MADNELIRRGDAELVVDTQRVIEARPGAAPPVGHGKGRIVLPPPPETQLRPSPSWLRARRGR